MINSTQTPNKLINEKSPYLLQHAYNPVQWYPWGEEAFAKAKQENKPIFLSIGYSTCHWCHVMERESFEDQEVASLLNEKFVAIKVDREERPDIDSVYMEACQRMTGQGGWPLTIVMTPGQNPFYAATYLPKRSEWGGGLMEVLSLIAEKWNANPKSLESFGEKVREALGEEEQLKKGNDKEGIIQSAYQSIRASFDNHYGGFGSAPKFPTPHRIMFLLRYHKLTRDEDALKMALKTLKSMYRGGMFDHIGYGFSRYSTDDKWLIPHFEKMLYDNALLALAYLEAFQITGDEFYAETAEKTLSYMEAELRDELGGFHSAQDADSNGIEGLFYAFTPDEALKVLGERDGEFWNNAYGVRKEGNFEGKSIPNLLFGDLDEHAKRRLESMRERMLSYRKNRFNLHKDDKMLCSWNAMAAAAFFRAGYALDRPGLIQAAEKTMRFIDERLTNEQGGLYAACRNGKAYGAGRLDDYAFLSWAALEGYDATLNARYLEQAARLCATMLSDFFNEEQGGFYLYGKTQEKLITRPRDTYDGAIPSGNSVCAYTLYRTARLTGDAAIERGARKQAEFMAGRAADYPSGHCFGLIALMPYVYGAREIVCVAPDEREAERIAAERRGRFFPFTSFIIKTEGDRALRNAAAFTERYHLIGDEAAFYLCSDQACRAPVAGLQAFKKMLDEE